MVNDLTVSSWKELVKKIDMLPYLSRSTSRRKDDAKLYNTLEKVFGKKWFLKNINAIIGNKKTILLPNMFPYTTITTQIPHVVHYVLWSKKGKLSEQEIEKLIEKKFKGKKYLYFERPRKSIPEIMHYQVFIKLK